MTEVAFRDVGKVFPDGTRALGDFTLNIADGEFMVLVGPSGCGKTTALRLLAGLETVTEGEIVIGEEVVNDWTPQQRNVAMVFQNYALYPHMTVRENIEFPLRMRGLPPDERAQRVMQAVDLLGLAGVLERRPKSLSGGQRQRVAMGRAIVRNPTVFLMDEPLSNLDARLRVQIRTEIAALQHKMGITTLYVTHDQVEAMTLGDRVAVLNAGRLQQVAVPQDLYEKPANTFVAGFIGSPPMNLFDAVLHEANGGLAVEIAGQHIGINDMAARHRPGIQAFLNKTLIAGLHPDAFALPVEGHERPVLRVVVEGSEYLGSELLLYFRFPGSDKFARSHGSTRSAGVARLLSSPRQRRQPGETLALAVDPGRFYFFTPDGAAIT